MKYRKNSQGYILRLEKGDKIIDTIAKFCREESIFSASILGIGAVTSVELGYYRLDKKDYDWKIFDIPMEVVSLTGNLTTVDSQPFLHIHTVLADSEYQAIGGHLKEGTVNATLEIFMQTLSTPISRTLDEDIGLKLLQLEDW